MKTHRSTILVILCLTALVFFPACLEIVTTSQMNSDGSVDRTITFEDDSASVYRGNFPIPLDSQWQRSIQKLDVNKFRLTATRHFRDANEMNEALKGIYGKTLQFQFTVERSFRWFVTKYRYTETNLKYVQYDSVPLTDFVTQSEIDKWQQYEIQKKPFATRGDSLSLMSAGPREEEWEERNVFEAVFPAFLGGVQRLQNPSLKASDVVGQKDTLFSRTKDFVRGNLDTLPFIFARVLKNPAVHSAWKANIQEISEIKRKATLKFGGSYVTNVVMPGLITGSNAPTIEGNKATWRDYSDYARLVGYTMWVESEQMNTWAVVLTSALVVGLAILLIASSLKRRRLLY